MRSLIHDLSYSLQNNQRSNSKFAQLHFFAIMKDKIDKTGSVEKAQTGTDWHRLAQTGTDWHRLAQTGTDWHRLAQNWYSLGKDWHRLAQTGTDH